MSWTRALSQSYFERPAWSLRTWLVIALALRIPGVLFADGYDYPDQQFQYVDPAWHLATGHAIHVTWESIDGVRSDVYPWLLAAVFRGLLVFGLDDPMWMMRATRLVHAIASLLPLWLFWSVVARWNALPNPRVPLLLFAGSGWLISAGVQPSAPAFGATLAVAAAMAVHGPRWFPALGGVCLGIAFCCRPQEALFGPALLAVLLWQRRYRAAVAFAFGCLPGIALQGFADLCSHGRFLATVWNYVHTNLVLGSATKWQTQGWYFYLAAIAATLLVVPPFLRTAWERLRAGTLLLPGATAAAVLHVAVHSCIARKALRFELAAFASLLAVVAAGIASRGVRTRVAAWYPRLLCGIHGAMCLYASFWFGNAGAVQSALAMRRDPAVNAPILVVDGDATSLGGFFYMRPTADRVESVARAGLGALVAASPRRSGELLVTMRQPLDAPSLALGLEPVGVFPGMFDLRKGDRRFVYRWR